MAPVAGFILAYIRFLKLLTGSVKYETPKKAPTKVPIKAKFDTPGIAAPGVY